MKKVFKIFLIVLLVFLCGCSNTTSYEQQETSCDTFSKGIITAEEVNIREEPNIDSEVIGKFYKNTIIYSTKVTNEWNKVKLANSSIGYIFSTYITTISEEEFEIYQDYQILDSSPKYGIISSDYSNLTSLPNTQDSEIIAVFAKNDTVKILGITQNKWYVTKYNDILCYIFHDDLREISLEDYNSFETLPTKRASVEGCSLIGEYTTNYYSSNENRNYNVKKSASEMDGFLIEANAMFNWCRDMGPCGQFEGYKSSKEIVNDEYVTGYGGGICQLSSTLCAAVISSGKNFEFIERNKHSIPQSYIPADLDATVSYPDCNFIFKNNNPYDIIIKTNCKDYNLTVEIYATV